MSFSRRLHARPQKKKRKVAFETEPNFIVENVTIPFTNRQGD